MSNTSRCSACGKTIRWAVTTAGRRIPLDPEPVSDGTVVIADDGVAEVLKKDDLFDAGNADRLRYKAHWATCTDPQRFRKKRP